MGKNAFKYIFLCLSAYLLLCVIEVFLLRPLVDFIGFGFLSHLIVYLVLFLIINPIATKIITDMFSVSRLPKEKTDIPEI